MFFPIQVKVTRIYAIAAVQQKDLLKCFVEFRARYNRPAQPARWLVVLDNFAKCILHCIGFAVRYVLHHPSRFAEVAIDSLPTS